MKKPRLPHICHCGDHAFVSTTKARVILADPGDATTLAARCWSANNQNYAESPQGKLHRLLMNPPSGSWVDHINRDRLDNRRSNLRLCSPAESIRNRGKISRNGKPASRFKGVCLYAGQGWAARIAINGKRIFLGAFGSEEEAARAYDEAARKHHGKFASLNFEGDGLCQSQR